MPDSNNQEVLYSAELPGVPIAQIIFHAKRVYIYSGSRNPEDARRLAEWLTKHFLENKQ